MSVDITNENSNTKSGFKVTEKKPLVVQNNIGKNVVRKNYEFVRRQRSTVQRAFDMFLSLRPNRSLLTAIRDVQNARLAQDFVEEGGVQPSRECRERAKDILRSFSYENWHPRRIGASLLGGIMLVYKFSDERVFEVEVENDLEISCVVSQGKAVVHSEVFTSVAEVHRFVKYLQSRSKATT